MHTLQVECSNAIYEHLMFFLENLPRSEAVVYELDDTLQAMSEINNGKTTPIANFGDYLAKMTAECTN